MNMKGAWQRLFGRSSPIEPAADVPAAVVEPPHRPSTDVSLRSVLTGLRASHKHEMQVLAKHPERRKVERVVDNRAFILGLDELFRTGIIPHEHTELLPAARALASKLAILPAEVPLEGHYGQDPQLTEYFHLVSALQSLGEGERRRVADTPQFMRLHDVFSSPLFGASFVDGTLLSRGLDPVTVVMMNAGERTVMSVMNAAYRVAKERDDCSLVGMSCIARDPVAVVALRDPVVLPYQATTLGNAPIPTYTWRVDPEIADLADRFIATFQALFGEDLPEPIEENADLYGASYFDRAAPFGRCVRMNPTPIPDGDYFWAVYAEDDGKARIHEFRARQPWTTDIYRQAMPVGKGKAKL